MTKHSELNKAFFEQILAANGGYEKAPFAMLVAAQAAADAKERVVKTLIERIHAALRDGRAREEAKLAYAAVVRKLEAKAKAGDITLVDDLDACARQYGSII